jgi:hypothetical protein
VIVEKFSEAGEIPHFKSRHVCEELDCSVRHRESPSAINRLCFMGHRSSRLTT